MAARKTKQRPTEEFSFTWGLPLLNDLGFVRLYQFMLRTYAALGVTRQEMLCLIHLASYHYEYATGQSSPSLDTIATQMGYAHRQRVWELIQSLEKKGLVIITRRPGLTSIYNASPFAQTTYDLWLEQQSRQSHQSGGETTTDSVTPESNTHIQGTGETSGEGVTPHSNSGVTPHSNTLLLPIVHEQDQQDEDNKNVVVGVLTEFGITESMSKTIAELRSLDDAQGWIAYATGPRGNRLTDKVGFVVRQLLDGNTPPRNRRKARPGNNGQPSLLSGEFAEFIEH